MSYVNFNRALSRAQIEALGHGDPSDSSYEEATNGKIYFAKDGGIYVGNSNGTADKKADLNVSIPFANVDSTSTATVFTATVPGITQLKDGTCVMLHNGVVTSAEGCTLNINGLGAKPLFNNLTAATRDTTIFNVAYTMLFVYDATRVVDGITGAWCCYRGYDSNTNTIGYQLRTNSMSLPMTSVTYRYRLLFTSADGTHFVPANNSSSTNATSSRNVCQDPIDPFGEIVYYGTTASVAANSRPSAAALWIQYTLALGYSFNRTGAALTLTSWKPVYVKCAPQAGGSAIIDSTTPYVQNLPTTEDGKIYIFLGVAYSATNIELLAVHPVYYYKDGAIRLWTNKETEDDYVDIGLSVLWAKKNVGATTNYDPGNYYSWGEVTTKSDYSSSAYTYTDDPAILPESNDAASQNFGSIWRMPTKEEFEELVATKNNANYVWKRGRSVGHTFGVWITYLVNNNSIFLPSTGYYKSSSKTSSSEVNCWTGTIYGTAGTMAYAFSAEVNASSTSAKVSAAYRSYGYTIRPVKNKVDYYKTINNNSIVGQGNIEVQPTLVSGTNIKTINNTSLLGSGNITIGADTSDCEKLSNKVTTLSSSSTNNQYPSAKAVYDLVGDIEAALDAILTSNNAAIEQELASI